KNVVLVTHGMTLRMFLMRWFRWTIEEFETLRNPRNGDIVVMELDETTNKYKLVTELKRKKVAPDDVYPWTIRPQLKAR
ncbi:MAG TPA: histidine phosphatase family protein, partial [Phnomibacter sp.]|nr:histidine phosphatase family protein [Phnomibacter sp.]